MLIKLSYVIGNNKLFELRDFDCGDSDFRTVLYNISSCFCNVFFNGGDDDDDIGVYNNC